MSGGGSGGGSAPANTTSVNTQIVDLPTWEQQYMTSLLGQSQAAAANPYQQFPGQQVAGFTPDQTQAFSNVENLVNNNTAGNIQNAGVGSALQGANTANNITGAASPFLNAAAMQGSSQGVQNYMSPFLNQEIQGLQTNAQQLWNNTTAPQINDAFIGAGQFGSGRNAQVIGQQASLADQALTGQIANAANSAYSTAGTLAQNQASNLAGIGNNLGNLTNTQAGTQANIGTALGNLGNTVQNTGITGATALQDVGQQQQQLNQQNINTAMTNFQNQVQYPETQLSWLSNILHGLPSTTGTTGTSTGAMTNNVVGGVSPLSSLGGALIGTGGLAAAGSAATSSGAAGNLAQGGLIKGYADGGVVEDDSDINPLVALMSNSLGDQNWQAPSDVDVDSASGISMPASAMSTISHAASPVPLPPPSQQQTTSNPAPTDGYQSPTNSNPLTMIKAPSAPQFDPEQQRGYQLLAMAKGLLTPAHSGAEALGNAIGNYAQTGMDQQKWQAEMQAKYAPMQIEAAKANNEATNQQKQREFENQRLQQEAKYQQGELGMRGQQLAQEAKYQSGELNLRGEQVAQGRFQPVKDVFGNVTGVINGKTGEITPITALNSQANIVDPLAAGNESPSADPQKAAMQILAENGVPPTQVMTRQDISGRNQQTKAYNDAALSAKSALQQLQSLNEQTGKYTPGGGHNLLYKGEQYVGLGGDEATARAEADKASKNLANAFMQANTGARGAGIKMVEFDAGAVPNADMTDQARNDLVKKQSAIANSQIQRAAISNMYPRMHMNDVNAIMEAYEQKVPPLLPSGNANPNWMPYNKWLAAGRPDTTVVSAPTGGDRGNGTPAIPEALAGISGIHYSPSRKQYRDSSGKIYDINGKEVK